MMTFVKLEENFYILFFWTKVRDTRFETETSPGSLSLVSVSVSKKFISREIVYV